MLYVVGEKWELTVQVYNPDGELDNDDAIHKAQEHVKEHFAGHPYHAWELCDTDRLNYNKVDVIFTQ
jgi:hypothetical protein